jgi:UDP-N-acetylglucosamine 2-epimerase (non-hydrolysing)
MAINFKTKNILIVFGTRPEAIKMAPLIKLLKEKMSVKVCVTAQHREMLDQVMAIFDIKSDYDLNIMKNNQDLFDVSSNVLTEMKLVIKECQPDLVLVHGDTTTSMATSLAAFYLQIPIGHIEAGLRTYNINSPFPEEMNRQVVSRLANFHFAPTIEAQNNLKKEYLPSSNIYVTGNTVIDSLFSILERARSSNYSDELLIKAPFLVKNLSSSRIILVTGHRRENFGEGFEEICWALHDIAKQNSNVQIIYPVHLNPNVREPVMRIISNIHNISLVDPMDYISFTKLMDDAYFILTDSGGIQEEAPSLGKPVLVMRNNTERPEALRAGTVKLVGSDRNKIVNAANQLLGSIEEYNKMSTAHNPYGDGDASMKICKVIEDHT